jgi:regulator of sirC expression with transglutaminase-like and TPR domain
VLPCTKAYTFVQLLIEKSGIPVAAIISARDLEWIEHFEAKRAERFKALDASWEAFRNAPPEEIEKEVAKAVAEARQELRRGS